MVCLSFRYRAVFRRISLVAKSRSRNGPHLVSKIRKAFKMQNWSLLSFDRLRSFGRRLGWARNFRELCYKNRLQIVDQLKEVSFHLILKYWRENSFNCMIPVKQYGPLKKIALIATVSQLKLKVSAWCCQVIIQVNLFTRLAVFWCTLRKLGIVLVAFLCHVF